MFDHPAARRPIVVSSVVWGRHDRHDHARVGHLVRLAVLLVAVVGLVVLATPRPAYAHASLDSASPSDGAVLDQAPDVARFTFNEPVSITAGALRVFDGDGARVDDGHQQEAGADEVVVGLGDLDDGGYVATYRVTSADGHVIRGALTFRVGAGTALDDATVSALFQEGGGFVGILAAGVRAIDYGAVLVAVGALAAAVAWVVTDRQRRLARRVADRAALVGMAATVLTIPLQAMQSSSLGFAVLGSSEVMGDTLTSTVGLGALTRLAGLVLVLAAVRMLARREAAGGADEATPGPHDRTTPMVAGAAVLALGSLLLDGHTRTVGPAAVMLVGDAVHVAAAAAWAGGLVVLARLVAMTRPGASAASTGHGPVSSHDDGAGPTPGMPTPAGDAGRDGAVPAVSAGAATATVATGPRRAGGRRPGSRTAGADVAARPVDAVDAVDGVDGVEVHADDDPDRADGDRADRDEDGSMAVAQALANWSGWALWSIGALVVAGSAMSWALVRQPRALTSTDQGWTLVAKVGLVAVLLVVAAWNHWRLVPAITSHGPDEAAARDQLRSSVRVEVVLLALVLATTAVLVNLRPAAAEAGIDGAFDTVVALDDDTDLNLVVDPNRAGANQVHVYILDATGRPVQDATDVRMELLQVEADIGPLLREPRSAGPGHWILRGPDLAVPGPWEITTIVGQDRFSELSATVEVVVNPS